jgi:4-hydroxy-2-oxoheptanedioate aldolase
MTTEGAWRLRARLDGEGPITNAWLSLSDPFVAELIASQGWHAVTVDRQHGRVGPGGLWELALAITARGASPMARISHLDVAEICHTLDAGFEGIICPMVNSPEEARALVEACKYPPVGMRSFGPTRAALGRETDFVAVSGASTVCLAMIETRAALDRLDGILEQPGLDGVYIGPADLALSLGRPPALDDTSEETLELLEGIARRTIAHGKVAAVHCASADYARLMTGYGYRLVTVGSDVRFLRAAGSAAFNAWSERAQAVAGRT